MQTVINNFVSITQLTLDLYLSTVLHAIVFRTLPRETFLISMFIFPTPCFWAQFQRATSYALGQKKALLWILNKWIYSTSRIRKVLKAFRINKRQSDIDVREKLSSLCFSFFFSFSLCIRDSESITEDIINQCFWTELHRTII